MSQRDHSLSVMRPQPQMGYFAEENQESWLTVNKMIFTAFLSPVTLNPTFRAVERDRWRTKGAGKERAVSLYFYVLVFVVLRIPQRFHCSGS